MYKSTKKIKRQQEWDLMNRPFELNLYVLGISMLILLLKDLCDYFVICLHTVIQDLKSGYAVSDNTYDGTTYDKGEWVSTRAS